jgi:hypothetical protein
MVSLIWKKRALPIYWLLLSKKGSPKGRREASAVAYRFAYSNFYEQVATIRPILRLLKEYKLVVIGAREYRSTAFALWLTKKKIDFVLRLNKNTKIKSRSKKYQSLDSLDIKPGDKVLYNGVLVTENNQKTRFNVVVYWRRKYNNKQLASPWYLLTNFDNKEEIIKIFADRGGIEAMFRDCPKGLASRRKSGGDNLYGSQANTQRLTNLILLYRERLYCQLFSRIKHEKYWLSRVY